MSPIQPEPPQMTRPATTEAPAPETPAHWDTVRRTVEQVRAVGRAYLYGQCWLGWQLATLKEQHGKSGAGNNRTSPNGQFGHTGETWAEIVERETGLPRRTADRLIKLFEATKAKLKRTSGALVARGALVVFEAENPLTVPEEERAELQEIIASLVEGETQGSLMQELGVIPSPKPMPKGGGKKKEQTYETGELALIFFEPLAQTLLETRTSKDFKTYLAALPPHPLEPGKPALDTLESDCRAILAEIEAAKAAHLKPATGRTLS